MSGNRERALWAVALGLAIVLAIATLGGVAEAAVGDLIPGTPVAIPTGEGGATCAGFDGATVFGTALAIVPGGKLSFPSIPTLVVTSCMSIGASPSNLFFLDPSTNPATVKSTISTTVSAGWSALAFRADTADLLACNNGDGVSMYVIHFSPFDSVATGGTTRFFSSAPSGATCDGIAWDASDKTIYQTSFNSTTGSTDILHYAPVSDGVPTPTSIPSGCPGSVGGIGIAGASLVVSCDKFTPDGPGTPSPALIRQLDKTNGNLVRMFMNTNLPDFTAGVPDDPTTFASKDALWTKDVNGGQLLAFEFPAGTLGQKTGPPLLFPAACDQVNGSTPDADGDGLLDCWEDQGNWSDHLPGISVDGTYSANRSPSFRAVTLCVDQNGNNTFDAGECASVNHEDIFVEIDYMQFHKPDPTAVTNIIAAFANAPNANPDGTTGIRLHLQIDEQLPHVANTALIPCTPGPGAGDANFDTIKAASFGTVSEHGNAQTLNAKRNAFHYMLVTHNQTGSTASGCAEIGGNDILVSLGSFAGTVTGHTGGVGSTDQQGGTFMHELGHNLGLRHGGGDNINCKPNYPSLMSYSRQFSTPLNPRPLDYSRQLLGVSITTPSGQQVIGLDENSLNETVGVGAFTGSVIFGPPVSIPFQGTKPKVVSVSGGGIDWNNNGVINQGIPLRDINNTGIAGCPASPGEQLVGFNDWANIKLNFRTSIDFGDGAHATIDASKAVDVNNSTNQPAGSLEITPEEAIAMGYDTDRDCVPDVLDNCPLTPNGFGTRAEDGSCPVQPPSFTQVDANQNGVGDACEVAIDVLRPTIPSTSQGVVQIAIFSSVTRDATMIDPSTIVVTGSSTDGTGIWSVRVVENPVGNFQCSKRDVNGDGRADLVCKFKVDARLLPIGTSNVTLDGLTFGGEEVRGLDTLDVKAVGNGN